jgi:hypothetical protein
MKLNKLLPILQGLYDRGYGEADVSYVSDIDETTYSIRSIQKITEETQFEEGVSVQHFIVLFDVNGKVDANSVSD